MEKLQDLIQGNIFKGYAYSYPHKSAYRPLAKPISLQELWASEHKQHLFLYVHVPFCEMRCGFCNLFTIANPKENLESPFIQALERQAIEVKKALGASSFSRIAIGGGTPTFLSISDLEKLFYLINEVMGADTRSLPISVEMSPKTAEAEKIALLGEQGVTRASIGVQSFLLAETKTLGRPQKTEQVYQALKNIQDAAIPEMNIDLIYGIARQTVESWKYSLQQTLDYQPTEVFLYPLYVRPLTGLGLKGAEWDDHRKRLFRFGRDFLLANGYEQLTMRQFRLKNAISIPAPPYSSVEDGMVGLGVGARSYTQKFHYSSDYAVGKKQIRPIIHEFNQLQAADFSQANYGVWLNQEEQKRRYIIKSLLEGIYLDLKQYRDFFGSQALADFPELYELYDLNLAKKQADRLQLNLEGLELSDVIGPWLYSIETKVAMENFELV